MGKENSNNGFDFHRLSSEAQIGLFLAIAIALVGAIAALGSADSARYDRERNPAYWHYKHHFFQSNECTDSCKFMENMPNIPQESNDGSK